MKFTALLICCGVFVLSLSTVSLRISHRSEARAQELAAPASPTETLKMDWFDAKRARTVPVTLHFPRADAKRAGANPAPLPLLIISHGLGGTRDSLGYLGQFWAARGYICAQIQHPGSDEGVWKGAARPMQGMMKAAADPKAMNDRPLDVKFAIDTMLALNKDAKSPLFGRIDAAKIGVAGHSFGAFTALAAVGRGAILAPQWRDPRISASIALSPPSKGLEESRAQYHDFKTPFYILTGTLDGTTDNDAMAQGGMARGGMRRGAMGQGGMAGGGMIRGAMGQGGMAGITIGDTKAEDRRVPFDAIQGVEGQLLILNGANHATLGGGQRSQLPADTANIALIQSSTLLFWDAYLKGSPAAKKQLRGGDFARELGAQGSFETK